MKRAALALLGLLVSVPAFAQPLTLPGCRVSDYGNGIYYLSCYEVGPALSKLRELYPQVTISLSSSTLGAFSTGTTGYYVILNPAPQK